MTTNPRYYFAILFAVLLAMTLGLSSLTQGPRAKGSDSDPNQFSAGRAYTHLEDLLENNLPHPTGSVENLKIRKQIEQKFTQLGYAPQIQTALACTLHFPGCAQIENIIVHVPGTGNGDGVMLLAHYDSVPAGPAAADDGSGTVALIEIARILKSMSPLKNDVIFLITDGEEGGLRGAQAFANEHPLMGTIKLVVNLESRGSSGPSAMFETSDGNRQLIQTYAKKANRPVANSLSYEVYKRLPNDTDYSVFKRLGVAGLNFAFTGDVALYHSARDTPALLSKASLQHTGDNTLAALQAFGNEDLSVLIGTKDATYFDVFGRFIVHWPANLNMPLSLFALLVFLITIGARRENRRASLSSIPLGLAVVILTPLAGWILSYPLGRWPQLFYLDHPTPWPGRLALICAGLLVPWILAYKGRRWLKAAHYNTLILTAGLVFALGALIFSALLPGASYLLLVPALALSIGLLIDLLRKHQHYILAAHLGFLASAYMALYHFLALDVIANYGVSYIKILPMILLGLIALPIFWGRTAGGLATPKRFGMGLVALMTVSTAISALAPGFNASHPRGQNLIYLQDSDEQTAQWISAGIGGQDKAFVQQAGFDPSAPTNILFNLAYGDILAKSARYQDQPGVNYTVHSNTVSAGIREAVLDIHSSHQGYELALAFDPNTHPDTIKINGQAAANYQQQTDRRPFSIRGPKGDVFRVELRGNADTFTSVVLVDSYSLTPDDLEGMAELRPENSAPLHAGDRAHIMVRVILN